MLKIFATNVVISKGYENSAALKYSEKGDSVRFRIGNRVYDTRAENNTRWINISVKAFGTVCERIKKMGLKDGSLINIIGRYDEDSWTDQTTGEHKTASVIILDDIEFAGGRPKDGQKSEEKENAVSPSPAQPSGGAGNFMGYQPFGAGSFYDES